VISVIRGDWSVDSVNDIQRELDRNEIVVPLTLRSGRIASKIAVIDKAIREHHPAFEELGGGPGFILFTSGTTGAPKAALHDFRKFRKRFAKPGKPYRTIMFLLFDHIGGWNTLFYTLAAGGVPIYLPDRQPDTVCRIIEQQKAELLPTTPTFLNMILFTQAYKRYDISCLKVVTYGTEPMPQTTLDAMCRVLPNTQFKQTYGLSEIGILGTKSESADSLWVKVGGLGYETQIRDGILWVRSDTSMVGYLNAPSPFDAAGWYCTGDRVEVRKDFVRFMGRDTEIINVGGVKVSPVEVESVILGMPGVRDVAVHGIPNEIMGQVVVAQVALQVAIDKKNEEELKLDIIRYCRSRLDKHAAPARIEIVENIEITDRYKKIH